MTRTREENARDAQLEELTAKIAEDKPGGPGGGNFTVMSEMQKRLIDFAEHTLARLENDELWDTDTFDSITDKAKELELAGWNGHKFQRRFVRGRHRLHRLLETPADERSEQVRYLIDTKEIDT